YETGYAFLNRLVKSCLVEAKGQNVNSQFQKILVFIQENAKTDLPLTKVAEHFYMNSSYLSRCLLYTS
ncbi:AraC family transcriptional regulator, partial [Enterococcus sp. S181_ASV_20]|nr:AraC family transcriptional regulator [Enterococcus sp. S181_ASV_20]